MGLLFGAKRELTLESLGVPLRSSGARGVSLPVGRESLQASVKWACLRLRADLISTTPLDVFRRVGGVQVEMTKPMVLSSPGGATLEPEEWLYSTQFDLDDCGNTFGIITGRDNLNLPTGIELVPSESVTVQVRNGVKSFRIDGKPYTAAEVWHERQFTTSGSPVGLSPTAYAAMTTAGYLSAQQFAAEWFSGGSIPAAHFKNTAKTVSGEESVKIKDRFANQITNGGLLVTGSDWEYNVLGAKASESAFIEQLRISAPDQCRFYGVPGDMVDVATDSGSITYANVNQRNLQLLVINLGPTYTRRERTFSARLLPQPRYAKFNTDALLRMDPATRSSKLIAEVAGRILAPSEAREIENRQPFTDDQLAEFDRLWPTRAPQTAPPAQASSSAAMEMLAASLAKPAAPVTVNNNLPPVTVDARTMEGAVSVPVSVDSRTMPGAVPITNNIDATTALLEDSIRVDARTTVTQSEPVAVEPVAIRKRIERGPDGSIVQIIEEQVPHE